MKKLILLLSLIITLIGCGGNSDHKQDKIENIIETEIYLSSHFWRSKLFNKAKYFEVIENQSDYELFIDALNSSLSEIKESKAISTTAIDFDKNYLLFYATKYNAYEQIGEYKEYITIDENLSATIEQRFTGHKKVSTDNDDAQAYIENSYTIAGVQIRVYQVSQEINYIDMIHEDEISNISKEYPNGKPNRKVINILTTLNGGSEENDIVKLFDNNESFQNFLDINYKNSSYADEEGVGNNLQTNNIDFSRYRVLFTRILKGGITPLYAFVEEVSFPTKTSTLINNTLVNPKNICCTAQSAAMSNQIRVYIISRDIESIEISFPGEFNVAITADEAI